MRARGRPLALASLTWFAASCGGPSTTEEPARKGLDVVLITIDTLRADALGFSGNARSKTPNMDALAARARVFPNAHAHNVVTLPSHANILSGLLPYEHGIRDNAGFRFPEKLPTLATRLSALGYETAAFVSAFPLDSRFGLARGFSVYDDRYGKGTRSLSFELAERPGPETVSAALAWYRSKPPGKRFLWVHLFEPHAPYIPPASLRDAFANEPYLGEVAAADAALGPLLEQVSTSPALIVLTADHGESLGEHGEATHGLFVYEATLHVPLVVAGPGIPPGPYAGSASHIDIVPTVLAALAAPADPALPGRSLLSPETAARVLYFESLSTHLNRGWAPLTGVLADKTKYIDLPVRELYDLAQDPKELTNLAASRDGEVRAMKRLVPAKAGAAIARAAPSSEEAARLRSLGYVTSAGASTPKTRAYTAEDDPKNLRAIDQGLHRVIDLYQRGELAKAIREGEELVKTRPGVLVGAEHLAFLYQQAERPKDAIRLLSGLVKSGEANEAIRVRLGLVLSENGRAKEAVEVLAPLSASEDPDTLNALGIALSDARAFARARETFERSLRIDPENPSTYLNAGISALKEGKPDEACERLKAALARNPELGPALNALGAAEASRGHIDEALAAWAKAVSVNPSDLDALYNLGTTAARHDRPQEAAAALRLFLERAPANLTKERREAAAMLKSLDSMSTTQERSSK